LCYGSRGGGAHLAFHHQVGAYDTDTLIGALGQLRRALGGQKATLLWDGLPAHRSHAMHAWLRRQRHWLVVEPLPAYAPDLNPVEALWSSLKGVELANLAGEASTTSSRRPSVASSGSGAPRTWLSPSCATAVCPYGEKRPCHWNERASVSSASAPSGRTAADGYRGPGTAGCGPQPR
jgi:putative transposase